MEASTQTVPVTVAADFAAPRARHRIGLITLATDETTEPDFQAMLPSDVAFFTARILNENPVSKQTLRGHLPLIRQATEQLLPGAPLDVIVYDCTSGTVANGYEAIAAQVHALRPSVNVVTPITAALAALEALGVERISVLTPYTADVSDSVVAYLDEHGITVINAASFMIESDLDMARLSPESIYKAALETCAQDAQALFISCTALRAVEVIGRIESELGKPVVSSIQAEFWQSIRLAGNSEPLDGFGSLLRDH
jgi:maleate isomerase